jgi:hypothetical protein
MGLAALDSRGRDRNDRYYELDLYARAPGQGLMTKRRGRIGSGGFFLEGAGLELGDEVDVKFMLPTTRHWTWARGLVLEYVDGPDYSGVRCRFTELGLGDRYFLAHWIEAQA